MCRLGATVEHQVLGAQMRSVSQKHLHQEAPYNTKDSNMAATRLVKDMCNHTSQEEYDFTLQG